MNYYKNFSLENIVKKINSIVYTERWKVISGYEFYQVSTFGRIWSVKSNKFLKQSFDKDGYLLVKLYNDGSSKTKRVHQLVILAFRKKHKNKPIPNHINGKKNDNILTNLIWNTHSENTKHSFDVLGRKGYWTGKTGDKNKDSKKVLCITNGIIYGSLREAERKLKCSSANISRICNGTRKQDNGLTFKFI